MSGPEQDQELEDFLARRSLVYQRLSERDHAEPPPELDGLVLTKAREAIEAQSHVPSFRSSRWALPVALAATVVLSLAVVLNLGRGVFTHNDAASPVTAMKNEQALEPREAARPRERPPVVVADTAAAPNAPAVAPPPSSDAPLPVLEAESGGADAAKRRVADDALVAANEATADSAHAEVFSGRVRHEPPPSALSANARGAALQVAPAAESDATARDGSAAALTDEARRANPQAWLREIEQLRAAGKVAEANREMAAFRKAFPEHPRSAVATPPVQ